MAQSELLKSLLHGTAPKNLRILAARGLVPLPLKEMLEALVGLVNDPDQDIVSQAARSIGDWTEQDIISQLKARDCAPSVLEHFAGSGASESVLGAVVSNPSAPAKLIEDLALTIPARLLETVLDNRVRILEFPGILANVKQNPAATPEIMRLVKEIEIEFFGEKKKEYVVEAAPESLVPEIQALEMEFEIPPEELSLEGLPTDPEVRQAAMTQRLSKLSIPEKIRHALFGNREIRAILIRDPNKEVARTVLRSPKITDNEVESIAAMRGVAEDILREIGNRKEWTRNYGVVQNLVRNPKTPPLISQRMLSRLHSNDLQRLTRDRGIPEAVRLNAVRTLNQRMSSRSFQ